MRDRRSDLSLIGSPKSPATERGFFMPQIYL